MIRTQTHRDKLPVGDRPGWELEENNGNGKALKSVADSFVILQSLRLSRQKWISGTFPKFSSKSRGGKPPDIVPPPHTIQTRGKCDLQIGPHTFLGTTFYEVHYLPIQAHATPISTPAYMYRPPGSSWATTTPYGGVTPYAASAYRPGTQAATVHATTSASATPLLSPPSASITPALIAQVNASASSNPMLANLLQLAAAGKASPEQLKSLGILIQSMAGESSANPAAPVAPAVPGPSTSQIPTPIPASKPCSPLVKEFDLVLEFQETSWDRWILPRGRVVCERVLIGGLAASTTDILITMGIPFSPAPISGESAIAHAEAGVDEIPPQVVTFRLCKAPPTVWDTVYRWVGRDEGMAASRKQLELLNSPPRVYLAHQLPEGALLTQLQNAAAPPFGTKSIKPIQLGPQRPKRKPAAPRKPRIDSPGKEGGGSRISTPPVARNRKPVQATTFGTVPPIACRSCGSNGVPLILGGRFCRPCVDSGKANPDVPQASGSKLPARPSYKPSIPSLTAPSPLATHPPTFPPADADDTGSLETDVDGNK